MINKLMGYVAFYDGKARVILRPPTPLTIFRNEMKKIKDCPVEKPASVENKKL